MKKVIMLVLTLSLLFTYKVSADENFYDNDKGVTFNQEEIEFLEYFFWPGVQDTMTQEDYDKFIESNIMNAPRIGQEIYETPDTRTTYIEDNARKFQLSYACDNGCLISVTLTWKGQPTIRSYDVMGAYLHNTELMNVPSTVIQTTAGGTSYTNLRNFSNGFGISMLLPQYGANIIANQLFRVKEQGTVYASYQHAMSNISLANSQNYTLSRVGYGNVFEFAGVAANTYDRMNGLNISF